MAMGQNPNRTPSEHQPIPRKIGSKIWVVNSPQTPKMGSFLVLTRRITCRITSRSPNDRWLRVLAAGAHQLAAHREGDAEHLVALVAPDVASAFASACASAQTPPFTSCLRVPRSVDFYGKKGTGILGWLNVTLKGNPSQKKVKLTLLAGVAGGNWWNQPREFFKTRGDGVQGSIAEKGGVEFLKPRVVCKRWFPTKPTKWAGFKARAFPSKGNGRFVSSSTKPFLNPVLV